MHVLSVLTGKPEKTPAKAGLTGHFKKPVTQAHVGRLGLEGDSIMDLDNHGGPDQAVYVFGDRDRAIWADALGQDLTAGYFGENVLVSDLATPHIAIGDILQIGEVTLQITSPRIPCATFAAHVGNGKVIKMFYQLERPGIYGRVVKEGSIETGAPVTLTPYNGDRITMVDFMRHYLQKFDDTAFLARIRNVPAHYKMHDLARERLGEA